MTPTTDKTPFVSHFVQVTTSPPRVTVPPLPQRPAVRLDGPAKPLRKRNREPLPPSDAAASAQRPDPARLADAFRHNLRTAALLPDGALQGLVRNLVTDRAHAEDLADLHLLMDVLVEERDGMDAVQVGQALQGLVDGLGGPDMATSLLEVLVDRVVCMGAGSPGRCLQEDLRALTTALVRGEHRLERLGKLVDLVMDTGLGLRMTRFGEALAGIALGLQAVSTPACRIDADLHQRMLARVLRHEPERTNIHIRIGLKALWDHLARPGALTPALRNTVINQLFEGRAAAGPRLLSSACRVLVESLSRHGDADDHRTAMLGSLVRESRRMSAEETFQSALGFGVGLGGSAISARTRAWLTTWLVKFQKLDPAAAWPTLYAGLAHWPEASDDLPDDVIDDVPPASSPGDAEALWSALALDESGEPPAAGLLRESKHTPALAQELALAQREATAYLGWRDRHARSQRSLASSLAVRSREVEDLVPPRDQARLRAMFPGLDQPAVQGKDA